MLSTTTLIMMWCITSIVDSTRRRACGRGHGTPLRGWRCPRRRVRVLSVPESEKFSGGVKYRLHYGTDAGETVIRYDNSHGRHERHTPDGLDENYEFPGYDAVQRRFWKGVEQVRDNQSGSGANTS